MTIRAICILALSALSLAACNANQQPRPMGAAVALAVRAQTANPDAGGTDPVTGMDGAAAANSLESYRKRFEPPKSPGGDVVIPLGKALGN